MLVACSGLSLPVAGANANDSQQRYEITIPELEADEALKALAQQTEVQVLFPYDLVKTLQAKPVFGRYTLHEALERLLQGTGLSSSLTKSGVITISASLTAEQNGDGNMNESRKMTLLGAVAAFFSSGTHPVWAEDTKPTLEEVIVTAQKREELLQNVPVSISVLSTAQLESATVASATDALRTVPGITTYQQYAGGGTVIAVRGVAAAGAVFTGTSPVAYYLDSIPFGLVKTAYGPNEDVYDLERIEVLRGPQGTLYGASAFNGVIRILTKEADLNNFDFKARGADSYTNGGGNNYQGDVAANVPIIEGKLAVRAVVGYENDDGWIDSPVKNHINDEKLRNYRLKINAQPTEDLSVGLSYWGIRNNYGAPSAGNDNYFNPSTSAQPQTTNFDTYAMKVAYSFSGYSLSSTTSKLKYRNFGNIDFAPFIGVPFGLFTEIDSDVFAQEVYLNSPTDGVWRWSIGGMFRRATEDRDQYNSISGPTAGFLDYDNLTSKSAAVFGEVTRLFLDGRLELTAGARRFQDKVTQTGGYPLFAVVPTDNNFHATTPRAVLTWHASDNLMVYGSFSEGFRSGFPQDVTDPPGLPPVKPDTLYNYEVGTKGSLWDGRASFDAAVYYMEWKNVQQSILVPFQDVYTAEIVNGNTAKGEGVDLAFTVQPVSGLTLGISGSWNALEFAGNVYSGGALLFKEGDRLIGSPETTLGASAAYVFPLGASGLNARVSTSANYASAMPLTTRSRPQKNGDPLVNAKVGLSIESPHWTTTLFADNINNCRAVIIRSSITPGFNDLSRPRTVGLEFSYHLR